MSACAFILAEVIPIFNYVLSLTGSICFAPLAMMLPGWVWLTGHGHYLHGNIWKMTQYWLHWGLVVLGLFYLAGGTYGTVLEITNAYRTGAIGMYL